MPSCMSSGRSSDSSAALTAAVSMVNVAKLAPLDIRSDGRRLAVPEDRELAGTLIGEEEEEGAGASTGKERRRGLAGSSKAEAVVGVVGMSTGSEMRRGMAGTSTGGDVEGLVEDVMRCPMRGHMLYTSYSRPLTIGDDGGVFSGATVEAGSITLEGESGVVGDMGTTKPLRGAHDAHLQSHPCFA